MNASDQSELQCMLESVIDLALRPLVAELSQETGQSILLKVTAVDSGYAPSASLYVGKTGAEDAATVSGEIRVVFKDPVRPSRFSVEAILDGLAPGTGYSGFSMRGRVRLDDGGPSVKVNGHTNRYNVREWGQEFRTA